MRSIEYLDPKQIKIPEDRQREQVDVTTLKESIKRDGQLQAILVDENNTLIAGERRLTACTELGIPVLTSVYDKESDKSIVEFVENNERTPLTWQEKVLAMSKIHNKLVGEQPLHTMQNTADILGCSKSYISKTLDLANNMDNEDIRTSKTRASALTVLSRKKITKKGDDINVDTPDFDLDAEPEEESKETLDTFDWSNPNEVDAPVKLDEEPKKPKKKKYPFPVKQGDFFEWAPNYDGKKFDVIHCDFPYGLEFGDSNNMAQGVGGYEDTPELYEKLLDCLCTNQNNFIAPNAHMFFWFSMNFYTETLMALEDAGWTVWSRPLVWAKSSRGTVPDRVRLPKSSYETCLFCYRGERSINKLRTNFFLSSGSSVVSHPSEKDLEMLVYFLSLAITPSSRVFDPTAGSGSALIAAKKLGAQTIEGLELDETFVEGLKKFWTSE